MDLNVSGLASGFDWKSMVDQLTNVERAPQRRMRTEQAGVRAKNAAFTRLKTELTSLKTVSEQLKETAFFDTRKVTSSETHPRPRRIRARHQANTILKSSSWLPRPSNWVPAMWVPR